MTRSALWLLTICWPVLLATAPGCGDDDADLGMTAFVLETGADTDADTDTDTDADTGGADPESLIEWVSIPAGSFPMGDGLTPETSPQHTVDVPGFEIARYEVTNSQYDACVEHDICDEPPEQYVDGDDHPVRGVSFGWANYFCGWVGGSLPSEAQWEYAARNPGVADSHPWGDAVATCDRAVMAIMPGIEPNWGCGTGKTFPVCDIPAGNTELGLCDMAGNVWEWMLDAWHDSYDGAPDDGSAWDEDSMSTRVVRGGGLNNLNPFHLRASFRYHLDYESWSEAAGFRCVREPQD